MSSLVTSSLSQSPSEVFMVRPGNFMFNMETAVTNHYQDKTSSSMEWHGVAMQEFDQAVETMCTLSIPLGYGGLIPQGPGGSIPLD